MNDKSANNCPNCGEELDVFFVWDDPDIGVAFNLLACEDCGTLVKDMVWDNAGRSVCKAGDQLGTPDRPAPGEESE
jgi:uncharacterized Zn finger protein